MKQALLACAAAAGCALVPAAPHDPSRSARSLAAAERDFAAQSVREDARSAFLAHFAPDGVLVRDGWAPAIPALTAQAPAPNLLDWHPAYVEAARSGELGLSTGPWKLAPRDGSRAPAYGHFVSVWRRDGGRWQVIADIGIAHGVAAAWDAPLEIHVGESAACGALDAAEAAFARAASTGGLRAALRELGSPRMRLYRAGAAPLEGSGEAIAASAVETALVYHVDASAVARSGELGYARGGYAGEDGKRGVWLRAWRCEARRWRVALDIVNATQ